MLERAGVYFHWENLVPTNHQYLKTSTCSKILMTWSLPAEWDSREVWDASLLWMVDSFHCTVMIQDLLHQVLPPSHRNWGGSSPLLFTGSGEQEEPVSGRVPTTSLPTQAVVARSATHTWDRGNASLSLQETEKQETKKKIQSSCIRSWPSSKSKSPWTRAR